MNPTTPPLPTLAETASQTAGPYVHIGLAPQQAGFDIFERNFGNVLAEPGTPGERVVVEGQVIDGSGTPLRDVLIELWQADVQGRYDAPGFRGWGRTGADFDSGLYRFETVKPGPVPGLRGEPQAPHLNLWIVARGINLGLNTRMYFSDEAAANEQDAVLNSIEWASRRRTLVGQRQQRDGETVYRFDIVLQSHDPARETVFFDV
jgi:protocatechuate 3,4-dioxygenase alpha subunit